MTKRWLGILVLALVTGVPAPSAPVPTKRVAFIVESWYPTSHADVIGTRLLGGYRIGGQTYASPVTIASVYTDAPRTNDQTRALAARYGFRVAGSIADALLEDPKSAAPRLGVHGILIGTREDLPRNGSQLSSPTPRLGTFREVLRILDVAGARVPIFIDKMLSANWGDAQTIVREAEQRGITLMAGSVLAFMPYDRPVRTGRIEVAVVIASAPYWAYAFHAAEMLQSFMERRSERETGISSIREVGAAYWTLPDRDRWGGKLFDALLASAKTRTGRGVNSAQGLGPEFYALLIQYADGTRAVLSLVPYAFEEAEFLLGAQFADGSTSLGGVVLPGEPFDHFGSLVHALVDLYTSGRSPAPVGRTLLSTGLVLQGSAARHSGLISDPSLRIIYAPPRRP